MTGQRCDYLRPRRLRADRSHQHPSGESAQVAEIVFDRQWATFGLLKKIRETIQRGSHVHLSAFYTSSFYRDKSRFRRGYTPSLAGCHRVNLVIRGELSFALPLTEIYVLRAAANPTGHCHHRLPPSY